MTLRLSINPIRMSLKVLGMILGIKKGHMLQGEPCAKALHHLSHRRELLPHPYDGPALRDAYPMRGLNRE